MTHSSSKPSLSMLPYDMLMVILSKVTLVSHVDLGACMASCKDMLNVSKFPEVLRSLRLEDVAPPPYELVPSTMEIVEEHAKNGNIHATFLCGLFNYFHLKHVTIGLTQLSFAASETHLEAMYLYGMILLIKGDFTEGCNFLTQLWKKHGFETVRQCHMNVHKVVLELSVREYREYDILLALMKVPENCIDEGLDEVCDDCFIRKEIYRYMDYFN
ncbi:BnaCnng09080D [Brassica napus]|uniref:At2g35280-like TPR domain-containing protein n=2 Tax=Brassica TaxID=3705 RepID=A0A3P6H1H1_BRAOL|nr:unnamed protein product [Brassica napus]CDY38047.1 BnaCnng09080D [Brassica napus]VDD59689.1 unnamed protein product [Brassica oleracea]